MKKLIRIAFDIGGVLSKYPHIWKPIIMVMAPLDVHIITDMHPNEKAVQVVHGNGFTMIPADHIHSADYAKYGEACKAVLCKELEIDILIDDFIGYVADPGATIRLLVMPNSAEPYYHPNWKTDEGVFGRALHKTLPAQDWRLGCILNSFSSSVCAKGTKCCENPEHYGPLIP